MKSHLRESRCNRGNALYVVILASYCLFAGGMSAHSAEICKGEADAFRGFIRDAGKIDAGFVPAGDLAFTEHKSIDGTRLRGFKASAGPRPNGAAEPLGAILFVQGNAMLADQMVPHLRYFAEAGFDTYIYDFRGYGRSEGTASLTPIFADYDEIIRELRTVPAPGGHPYRGLVVYAASAGGMFVVGGDAFATDIDAAFLDSVPANVNRKIKLFGLITVFELNCPEDVQPFKRMPIDMSRIAWYQGLKDGRVPYDRYGQHAALDLARDRHATIVLDPDAGHVFMDSEEATDRRLLRATEFFKQVLSEPTHAR